MLNFASADTATATPRADRPIPEHTLRKATAVAAFQVQTRKSAWRGKGASDITTPMAAAGRPGPATGAKVPMDNDALRAKWNA